MLSARCKGEHQDALQQEPWEMTLPVCVHSCDFNEELMEFQVPMPRSTSSWSWPRPACGEMSSCRMASKLDELSGRVDVLVCVEPDRSTHTLSATSERFGELMVI
jgi:hypothetical protein